MPLRRLLPALAAAVLAGAVLAACAAAPGAAASSAGGAPLTGTTWSLVELEGRTPPPGAGGRRATLRLEDGRVTGFAGCNTLFGGYTAGDGTLRFTDLGSTRMACDTGSELEGRFTAALAGVRAYRVTPEGLELRGESAVVARFVAGAAAGS